MPLEVRNAGACVKARVDRRSISDTPASPRGSQRSQEQEAATAHADLNLTTRRPQDHRRPRRVHRSHRDLQAGVVGPRPVAAFARARWASSANALSSPLAVMPAKAGIQYPAAFAIEPRKLWKTGSPPSRGRLRNAEMLLVEASSRLRRGPGMTALQA